MLPCAAAMEHADNFLLHRVRHLAVNATATIVLVVQIVPWHDAWTTALAMANAMRC